MMRSMEAFRRQLSTRSVAPVLAIIVTVHSPIDPNRRASGTGYGGVLPVPIPAAPTATVARKRCPWRSGWRCVRPWGLYPPRGRRLERMCAGLMAEEPRLRVKAAITKQYRNMYDVLSRHPAVAARLDQAQHRCGKNGSRI